MIIVGVRDGVNKTEDEAICGPVDDDVDGHVVFIDGCSVCVGPWSGRAGIAEVVTDPGEAREAGAGREVRYERKGRGRRGDTE